MEERARAARRHAARSVRAGAGTTVRLEVPAWLSAIRVLVVDDHAVVREGLRTFLSLQDGIEVVGEAGDGEEAVARGRAAAPGRRADGPRDAAARRRRRDARAAPRGSPGARVIVLTSFADDDRLLPAIRPAPPATCSRTSQPRELARAIRAAHAGEALLDPAVAARLRRGDRQPAASRRRSALTPREREVLALHRPRAVRTSAIARELGVVGEDRQDARRPHARQARRHRPHPGRAAAPCASGRG